MAASKHSIRGVFAWIVGSILLFFVVFAATGWSMLAIYFGDSSTGKAQILLAGGFGLVGLLASAGIFSRRFRWRFVFLFSVCFAAVLFWWLNIEPSNDRRWQADSEHLAYATIDGDKVTVHNVRNFAYRGETDFTPAWDTRSYDLAKLDSIDIYLVYWMGPEIAHTIVSFGFAGEDFLAVSIEARKEAGEGYSAVRGFFRQYELLYVVADERDVIRLRTNFRQDPPEDVYRYRLQGSAQIGREFFLEYMKSISEVARQPRFYNTLTSNCTNLIWLHGKVNPERVPFSWKLLASGYAAEYLYEMGKLDTSVSFDELTRRGYVNPRAKALDDGADFSRLIRE